MDTKEFIIKRTSPHRELTVNANSYSMSGGMMNFYKEEDKVFSLPVSDIEYIKQVTEDEEDNVSVMETEPTASYDHSNVQDGHVRYEGKIRSTSGEFAQEEEIPEDSTPQKDPGTGWDYVDDSGSIDNYKPKNSEGKR